MDEYGSITIDNKNLLEDLLGLETEYDNPNARLQLYRQNQQNQQNQYESSYLPKPPPPVQGRKFFLESPTFAKGEDDIYR